MRISIREQLGLLVLFCALTSLAVLALAVVRLVLSLKDNPPCSLPNSGFKIMLSSQISDYRASL